MSLGSFRINHSRTQSDSVNTYPPLPEKECLTWGDVNAALTTGKECLQEDGAIFIGANIEGRGSINKPNSDVGNAILDHRDHYIHLVNVDTR